MSDCIRCQHEANARERDARTRREKLAVAQLTGRLAKQGKKPTKAEVDAAKKNAHTQHEAKQRAKTIREKDKRNGVPNHRRI